MARQALMKEFSPGRAAGVAGMTPLVLARSRQSKRDGMAALYRSAATRATAGNHSLHELAATLNSAEATAYNSATGATL